MVTKERVGIHAETGTNCYATERACKYGESHVKNEEEFIVHQVKDNGLDESELRKVINDGASLSDAVQIVRLGDSLNVSNTLRKGSKSKETPRSKRELQALSKANTSDPAELLEIARHGSEKAREYLALNPYVTSEALNEAYKASESETVRKSLVRNVRMDLSVASVEDAVHGIVSRPHPAYETPSYAYNELHVAYENFTTTPMHNTFALRESEIRLRGPWVTREHLSALTQAMAERPGFDSTRPYDRHPAGILAHVALGESHKSFTHEEKYDLARYVPAVAKRMINEGDITNEEYANLPLGSREIGSNSDPDFIRFATKTLVESTAQDSHYNSDRERVAHSILLNENTPSDVLENPYWRTESGAYDIDLALHRNTPERLKRELLNEPAVRGHVNVEEAKKRAGLTGRDLASSLVASREVEEGEFRTIRRETLKLDPQALADYGLTKEGIDTLFEGIGTYDEKTQSYHMSYDTSD